MHHFHRTQGFVLLKKGSFFLLFLAAWSFSITKKLVYKSFEATCIWLKDPNVILKWFDSKKQEEAAEASHLTSSNWCYMERLVQAAVSNDIAEKLKKLSETLHSLAVQNKLLHNKNNSLWETLDNKKKHKNLYHSGATFWLPHKICQAQARELEKQQQEEAEM
jgi:hypothetical protein